MKKMMPGESVKDDGLSAIEEMKRIMNEIANRLKTELFERSGRVRRLADKFSFLVKLDSLDVENMEHLKTLQQHCQKFANHFETDVKSSSLYEEIFDCLTLFRSGKVGSGFTEFLLYRCIDMRIKCHAELSTWTPNDKRCVQRHYSAVSACKVVKKFSGIHFIGDSFIRKMARAFILVVRFDPANGALSKLYHERLRKFCKEREQFYWTECKMGDGSFKDFPSNQDPLCGIELESFSSRAFYNF